jgi:hypothetical protein
MTRTTRPAPLEGDTSEGKRLMKFDPTINSGTILQTVVIALSGVALFFGLKADNAATKADLEQTKAVAVIERAQTAQALAEIKLEMKEQGKTLGDLKEGIAILRGRAADTGVKR